MKILVTGGKDGQLARCLHERSANHPLLAVSFAEPPAFDLMKPETIVPIVEHVKPDVILSAAAYTAVDRCEDDAERAHQMNAVAPGVLAATARKIGARLIQISTDYIFDGTLSRPYLETDPAAPLGVYGRSKLGGEEAVRAALTDHIIIRTAWVYSPYSSNFVKTMLRLAESHDELGIVDDQNGNPTSAFDIADGVLAIIERWRTGSDVGLGEIYNLVGRDEMTWCDFARHIFAESEKRSGPTARVNAITTDDYPTKAARPANSRLDCGKLKRDFGFAARSITPCLEETFDAFAAE